MLTGKSQERLAELKEPFPELDIIHGYTDSYGKRRMVGFGDMGQEALLCLKEYLEECNMTVTELFSRFDEDGSNSVDYDEFRQGIRVRTFKFITHFKKFETHKMYNVLF